MFSQYQLSEFTTHVLQNGFQFQLVVVVAVVHGRCYRLAFNHLFVQTDLKSEATSHYFLGPNLHSLKTGIPPIQTQNTVRVRGIEHCTLNHRLGD